MTDRILTIPHIRGFSLLETLVALTILTLSLSAILGIFATALRAASEADAITRATRIGESLLAHLGNEIPLREGVSHGSLSTTYQWQIKVTPFLSEDARQSWQIPLQAYWVEVEVRRTASERHTAVKLSTLRLTTRRQVAL